MDVHKPTMVAPKKLVAAAYNPRRIQKRMMQALKQSLRTHGFVEPVVVRKTGMTIIGGHHRVQALFEVCAEDDIDTPRIPAIILDIDDRQARLLNLALNKIDGDYDANLLNAMLTEFKAERPLSADEILASGFTHREIERMSVDIPDAPDISTFAHSVTLSLKFDTVEERDATRALLNERVQKTGKKAGCIVRELLANGAK